ncbi:hypothetical protein DER44DRAFT_127478 [Fusarium oxysporum]|nr:hypothetical protein DER44DRAFT_127478 [Fusarium oxysporum]
MRIRGLLRPLGLAQATSIPSAHQLLRKAAINSTILWLSQCCSPLDANLMRAWCWRHSPLSFPRRSVPPVSLLTSVSGWLRGLKEWRALGQPRASWNLGATSRRYEKIESCGSALPEEASSGPLAPPRAGGWVH